jgi:phosphoribosylformylglycinamidine synthase
MKWGVVVFPGSNDDRDVSHVLADVLGQDVKFLWHRDRGLAGCDCVVLPGGFSYGDYLRPGAMAKFSEIMPAVNRFAQDGGPVLGICNGFQILCEAGLLPGTLIQNRSLRFVCKHVKVRIETVESPFTGLYQPQETLSLPVKHGDGCYFAPEEVLRELEGAGRVALRYVDGGGSQESTENPNGSLRNIAGILNRERNVLGLMPHPEHASEGVPGSTDGLRIFQSIMRSRRDLSP